MHLAYFCIKLNEVGLSYPKLIGDVKENIINIIMIPPQLD